MLSYLQIENISKSYGPKILFENIGFNVNEGDKIALIAPNGTGKTSLMKILAGKDKSDSGGKVVFLKDIRIAFLEQEYDFDPEKGIFEQIMHSSKKFTEHLLPEQIFEYEIRVQKFLTEFGLEDFDKEMKKLSGGEVKRVALSEMLASEADFFIMDEPTNHLDIEAIEYLENYLSRSRSTLLMVTHDRYFLDNVCNTVLEMDKGHLYEYKGSFTDFLEKRAERIENYNRETDKARNLLRRELEWMRSTPQARSGKAKYRQNAFYDLKDRAEATYTTKTASMDNVKGSARLGTKIINCKHLSFHYGERCLLDDFTYNFQRYERVGIVGKNGTGKSTFIKILMDKALKNGRLTGEIERGESLQIGYYQQEGMKFDEEQTVLETVNDTGLLNQFLFDHNMLNSKVSTLSGGEKRRLYLLTILMKRPNLLILDEPTNDLDIMTLEVLEDYLESFQGSLIIISHDRHFLDKLVDHMFIFLGDGKIKDFIGNYTDYREYIKEVNAQKRKAEREAKKLAQKENRGSTNGQSINGQSINNGQSGGQSNADSNKPKKLSFKEKYESEQLEKEIPVLTAKKKELGEKLNSGDLPYEEIAELSEEYAKISDKLDEKETRWLELTL